MSTPTCPLEWVNTQIKYPIKKNLCSIFKLKILQRFLTLILWQGLPIPREGRVNLYLFDDRKKGRCFFSYDVQNFLAKGTSSPPRRVPSPKSQIWGLVKKHAREKLQLVTHAYQVREQALGEQVFRERNCRANSQARSSYQAYTLHREHAFIALTGNARFR